MDELDFLVYLLLIPALLCAAIGGMALWASLMTRGAQLVRPILGESSMAVLCIAFPGVLLAAAYVILRFVGPDRFIWVIAPVIGCLCIYGARRIIRRDV